MTSTGIAGSGDTTGRSRRPLVGAVAVALGGCAVIALVTQSGTTKRPMPAGRGDDSELVGSVTHPALQSQGLPVKLLLSGGTAVMTVTGPQTPGQGLPFQNAYDTCTWTVTAAAGATALPLRLSDFDTVDHGGVIGHPTVVPGTTAPPAVLAPHRSATFAIREQMIIGEGLMRYAPDGIHVAAKWDFEVEND